MRKSTRPAPQKDWPCAFRTSGQSVQKIGERITARFFCVDIQKMNKGELTDISSMKLDPSVPQELRAAYMLKEMGNPYCFRVGDLGVKVEFLDNAPPLQDALSDFFQRKKSGL